MPTLSPLSLPTIDTVSLSAPPVLTLIGCEFRHADLFPAPLLCPLPDGSGVLVEDWSAPGCPAYHVPASLMAAVRSALDLRPASLATARAALPRVTAVHPGAVWPALTLQLNDGSTIDLQAGERAALQPVDTDGLALLICWKPDAAVLTVPAALMPELAPYFPAAGQA